MVNTKESNITIKNGLISVVKHSIYEERLNLHNRCKWDPCEAFPQKISIHNFINF